MKNLTVDPYYLSDSPLLLSLLNEPMRDSAIVGNATCLYKKLELKTFIKSASGVEKDLSTGFE